MKLLKCRSLLIALAGLLWISSCMADELTVVVSTVMATYDKQTGKPVVYVIFPQASYEPLLQWSQNNVGKMVELLINSQVVHRTMLKEPLYDRKLIFSDPDWTDLAEANALRRQFVKSPHGQVELRSSSQSN
ncbi:hypothetical protein [Bradyrhizobium mercantei]|uniref:hypothetical protein n=1 Tax=Bradyrhizobium mercantei TaxID=1904807 RepID=UPI000977A392|nr:hypothetical protein [Bradyrhizobium mercantei]